MQSLDCHMTVTCVHSLKGYYEEMAPDNNRVPVRLRGRRPDIFGNLHRIYKFHDQ